MQLKASGLWLAWTLATLVGYTLGILAVLNWVVILTYADRPAWLIGLAGGAVLGGVMGIAQWLVLRRHLPINAWWVLASIVGGALGLALGMPLAEALALPAVETTARGAATVAIPWPVVLQAGVTGAVVGFVLGGAQWLLLRHDLASTSWWIVVSGLGWMVGVGVGAALLPIVGLLGALLVSGLSGGAITGIVMQRWLRQER
jgi:hypothetical protein